PGAPSSGPPGPRRRQAPREESRPPLAAALVDALARRGRRAGESAFRVWLNAHLAPQRGWEVEASERFAAARDRIREALRLDLGAERHPEAPAPPEGQDEGRKRLTGLYRRWNRAVRH